LDLYGSYSTSITLPDLATVKTGPPSMTTLKKLLEKTCNSYCELIWLTETGLSLSISRYIFLKSRSVSDESIASP